MFLVRKSLVQMRQNTGIVARRQSTQADSNEDGVSPKKEWTYSDIRRAIKEVRSTKWPIRLATASSFSSSTIKYGAPLAAFYADMPETFYAGIGIGWAIHMIYPSLHQMLTLKIGPKFAEGLAIDAMKKFFTLPRDQVITDPLGKINQYFAKSFNSVYRIPNTIYGSLSPALINSVMATAGLSVVSPEIAAGYAASTALLAYVTTRGERNKAKAQEEFMASIYKIFGSTLQRINSYEIANTFAQADKEVNIYKRDLAEQTKERSRNIKININLAFQQSFIITASSIGMIAYAFQKMAAGVIMPMELSLVLYFLTMSMQSLKEVASAYSDFLDAKGDFVEVKNFINTYPSISSPEHPKKINLDEPPSISFKNVSFKYKDEEVIFDNASFEIPSGKKTVIVGLSGVGKTTIINLMLRFYDCEGSISINGTDIKEADILELRKLLGVAPQNPLLTDGTIKDNVCYGLNGTNDSRVEELDDVLQQSGLDTVITKYADGMETEIGKDGAKLSGGIRQRLSIARMLMLDSPVLIFDEATSSLDIETEMSILENIGRKNTNKTIIYITHRLNTIPSLNPDNILVVKDGKVVEKGTFECLMTQGGDFQRMMNKYQDSINSVDSTSAEEPSQQSLGCSR